MFEFFFTFSTIRYFKMSTLLQVQYLGGPLLTKAIMILLDNKESPLLELSLVPFPGYPVWQVSSLVGHVYEVQHLACESQGHK